jgi:hypothetical protein
MGFEWMSFSLKKNASTIKDSQELAKIVKFDHDKYAHLGPAPVDKAYAAYRAAYKALKNEIKRVQTALAKVIGENQNTIAALQAFDGRCEGLDQLGFKEIAAQGGGREGEDEYKEYWKQLDSLRYKANELRKLEEKIQANFKSLSAFLTKSKRAQE